MHIRLSAGLLVLALAWPLLAQEDNVSAIPAEIVGRVVFVDAKVNGKGPLKFILDTGATETVIIPAAAKQAGIASRRVSPNQQKGRVESVRVGDAVVSDFDVYVFDPPQALSLRLDKGMNYSGILGYTFLSHFVTTVDYQRSTVRFVPVASLPKGRPPLPEGAAAIPLQIAGGSLFVRGAINDRGPITFVVDTGSAEVLITPKVSQALGLVRVVRADYPAIGFARLAQVSLGPARVADIQAIIRSLPAERQMGGSCDGIIGYPFLSKFKVTVNYRDKLLVLEPPFTGAEQAK